MKIDLAKYLTERYHETLSQQDYDGPVVTIAREFGCPAKKIAALLTARLNEQGKADAEKSTWRWISKEILSESARELNLDPSDIRYVFKYEKKTVFDDILSSHSSKYYKSDRTIRKAIARVIRNIAREGNVIIVGRGGVAITRDIERSLHIKLKAPLEWRVLRIGEKYCLSEKKARKYIIEIDKKRQEFRDYYHGKGTDYTRFDVHYNCMTLSIEDIAESIMCLMRARKFI